MRRVVGVFALLTVALSIALWWKVREPKDLRLGSSGIVEGTKVLITTRIASRIESMRAKEGDFVKTGEILAELDCQEMDALVAEAQARVAMARSQLEVAKTQAEAAIMQAEAVKKQVASQRAQIASLRVQAENARRQSERAGRLKEQSAVSETTWETYDTTVRDLDARIQAATETASATTLNAKSVERQASSAIEQVKVAQAALGAAEAALTRALVGQSECIIIAPRDGVITLRAREPKEAVLPGYVLYELIDMSKTKVTFYVPNKELGSVRPNMKVSAVADAYPERTFPGVITRVSQEAEFTPRNVQTRTDRERLVYAVEAELENSEGLLRAGMPVEVQISEDRAH